MWCCAAWKVPDRQRGPIEGLSCRHVDALPETTSDADKTVLRQQRQRLETLLIAAIERGGADPKFPPAIADDDLVNALAQY